MAGHPGRCCSLPSVKPTPFFRSNPQPREQGARVTGRALTAFVGVASDGVALGLRAAGSGRPDSLLRTEPEHSATSPRPAASGLNPVPGIRIMKRALVLLCLTPTFAYPGTPAPPPLEMREVVELAPALPPGTVMAPFTLGGGDVVTLPVTDRGPLPARGGGYGMEFVGPLIGPLASGSKVPALTWSFSISARIGARCQEILVEEVSGKAPVVVARLQNPVLDTGIVQLSSSTREVSEATAPWLFERGPTIKVFRITFAGPEGRNVILHQPAWYSREAKAGLLETINRIRNGQ